MRRRNTGSAERRVQKIKRKVGRKRTSLALAADLRQRNKTLTRELKEERDQRKVPGSWALFFSERRLTSGALLCDPAILVRQSRGDTCYNAWIMAETKAREIDTDRPLRAGD